MPATVAVHKDTSIKFSLKILELKLDKIKTSYYAGTHC